MASDENQLPSAYLADVSDKLKAISHPLRLRIAETLEKQEEVKVGDIAGVCGENQPLVSQHLTQMRRAGIVSTRRKGTQVFYRLANENFKKILGCLRDDYNDTQHKPPVYSDLKKESLTPESDDLPEIPLIP